jgi:hypothetical protein
MLASSRYDRLLRTLASCRLDFERATGKPEYVLGGQRLAIRLQAANNMWAPVQAERRTEVQTNLHTEAAYEEVPRIRRWEPLKRLLASGTCRLSRLFSQKAAMKEN